MSDLARTVLPVIRTRADVWRWSTANDHGRQMHDAVDILQAAAETEDPVVVLGVTQKAIASAFKVIMRARAEPLGDGRQACRNNLGVDQPGIEECCDEVLVLLTQGAQLRDAEIFPVETLTSELRLAGRGSSVGVLPLDKPLVPAICRAEVSRSTPSMLKRCVCSNGENSPATPSITSASRAVLGRQQTTQRRDLAHL